MSASRARRVAVAFIVSLNLILGVVPGVSAADAAPIPTSMAAIGDSITRAASSAGSLGADAPQNSWSTGTSTTVNSHYLRLRTALSPNLVGHNLARSGAKAGNCGTTHPCFGDQIGSVLDLATEPDYVTVLIGGNDLCTDTVESMTSVPLFKSQFAAAMKTLMDETSRTHVYVVSIPDVWQLWNLFKNNFWARFIWSSAKICQSLLANPTSTNAADIQRRTDVQKRNSDYNAALKEVCESAANAPRCWFDQNAAFKFKFSTNDVSGDYFHPSLEGQRKLAEVSWNAGYEWVPSVPVNQAPTAVVAVPAQCTAGVVCTGFDGGGSIDPDGNPLTYTWAFGDGTTTTGATAAHTYASTAGSPYTVTLTVSDGNAADDAIASVAVIAPTTTTISLSVSPSKVKGIKTAALTWSGGVSTTVDVYRDGSVIVTTPNDGAHTDTIGKGSGTHTYKVCEVRTTTCSPAVSVSY